MASTSSSSKPNSNMLTTIKVNSPNVGHLFFSTRIPSPSSFPDVTGHRPTLRFDPSDPPDLQQLFERVAISSEGFLKSFIKMFDNLGSDGYVDLAMEMGHQFTEQGMMNPVVFLTGIIDEYAQAGKTNEALYVFRMMLVREGSVPNVYTYSVIIKALAADKDPNFHGVAKEIVMEMMRKGMQPTASAYVAVYEAFAGEVKMEEAKRFVEEMKGNGFVADRKARIGIRRVLEVKGAMVQSIIDILFDEGEGYSDESEDDDAVKKGIEMYDWSAYPPESFVPDSKQPTIEDDPENPKDLKHIFDRMCKNGPYVRTTVRMLTMLKDEGFLSQFADIMAVVADGKILDVVIHTGVMEIYGRRGETRQALKVFVWMVSLGVTPNAYTYSALIKVFARDPNYLADAKKYTLEMMEKGMKPNARTYIAVFKAFARLKDFKLERGKEFLKEMKAKGFVPKKKAVMEALKEKKGPLIKTVIKILLGK